MLEVLFWISVFFEITAFIFEVYKGRVVILISGLNSLSKVEMKKYDVNKVSKSISRIFFVCGLIIIIGIMLSEVFI